MTLLILHHRQQSKHRRTPQIRKEMRTLVPHRNNLVPQSVAACHLRVGDDLLVAVHFAENGCPYTGGLLVGLDALEGGESFGLDLLIC